MHIERFDPTVAEHHVLACHAMAVAGQPVDDPKVPPMSYGWFRGWWTFGFSGNPMQSWLATDDDGKPLGGYLLELPERENRRNGFGFVLVDPACRRRGIGTALLVHMARQSAQAGRRVLLSSTREGAPGNAFAIATAAVCGIRDARRSLTVDGRLGTRLAALRAAAEPHAAGYALRSWRGDTPAELIDGVCAVYTALGDAPHDESFEPEIWDPARLHTTEERVRAQGSRWYSVAALAPGRDLAALTQVSVEPSEPEWAWQEITAVTRPHRGHRLGLLVKVAMLEQLAAEEPLLRRVTTDNAEQNEHMVRVNEQLGYEVTDYFQWWEHDVARTVGLG